MVRNRTQADRRAQAAAARFWQQQQQKGQPPSNIPFYQQAQFWIELAIILLIVLLIVDPAFRDGLAHLPALLAGHP